MASANKVRSGLRQLKWRQANPPGFRAATFRGTEVAALRSDAETAHSPLLAALSRADALVAELPPNTSPVEAVRYLLRAAAEIEHSLLVQYLYALYSIERSVPAAQGWFQLLKRTAVDEMWHLMAVQNLLLAVGDTPYFDVQTGTPDATEQQLYPFPASLRPLSLDTLALYVAAESPPEEFLSPEAEQAARAALNHAKQLYPRGVNHVGVLYAQIYFLLQENDASQGPWSSPSVVAGRPGFDHGHLTQSDFAFDTLPRQSDGDDIGNPTIPIGPIESRATALDVVHAIAEQGEGWELPVGSTNESHFRRFVKTYAEFAAHPEPKPVKSLPIDPSFGPDPLPEPVLESNRIQDEAQPWAELLHARYRLLICCLALALEEPRGSMRRTALMDHAFATGMRDGVRLISIRLSAMPRKTGASEKAGPPLCLTAPPPVGSAALLSEISDLLHRSSQMMAILDPNGGTLGSLVNADQNLRLTLGM